VDADPYSESGHRRARLTKVKEKKFRNFMFEVLDVLF
jgi:hypothetical protein